MQKPLRAALATLGGLQRKLTSSPALVASCVSVVGCTHQTRLVAVSHASVRNGAAEVEQRGDGHVVDGDGDSHDISRDSKLYIGYGEEVSVGSLIDACKAPRGDKVCLLDQPAQWKYPDRHLTVDTGTIGGIAVLGLVGTLAYGNYECFGPGCSTGAKVAVGIGDALVVLSAVAIVELAKGFGSSSCGPLAPPCMPREELT